MTAITDETQTGLPTISDYARDLDELIREEGDRIRRILRRIDESMIAIHQSRSIFAK